MRSLMHANPADLCRGLRCDLLTIYRVIAGDLRMPMAGKEVHDLHRFATGTDILPWVASTEESFADPLEGRLQTRRSASGNRARHLIMRVLEQHIGAGNVREAATPLFALVYQIFSGSTPMIAILTRNWAKDAHTHGVTNRKTRETGRLNLPVNVG